MPDSIPAAQELEISVFGPGIGECVIAHIGDGDWIVIDSCIDRKSGRPIALEYLASLGVDVSSRVKLVVATHWHDDHIQGLAEILDAAKSAKFVDSAAFGLQSLARVVSLGNSTPAPSSATKEYGAIIQLLLKRQRNGERPDAVGPVRALANRRLLSLTSSERTVRCEIFALSPSDGVFNRAESELRDALAAIEHRLRPPSQGPNQLCVVLWLKIGVLNILLGADLEHVPGVTEGWQAILADAARPEGRATVFKVPHHGSANADCPECWTDLLLDKPVAILTPYSRSMLPKPQDIARLCARTEKVFLTSDPTAYGLPRRENAVEKTLREVALSRKALEGRMGQVRLRTDASTGDSAPIIELWNGARRQCH